MLQGELSQCVFYSTNDCCYYRVGHDKSSIICTVGKGKTISLNCGSDCGIGRIVHNFDNCCRNMSICLMKPCILKDVDINAATSA